MITKSATKKCEVTYHRRQGKHVLWCLLSEHLMSYHFYRNIIVHGRMNSPTIHSCIIYYYTWLQHIWLSYIIAIAHDHINNSTITYLFTCMWNTVLKFSKNYRQDMFVAIYLQQITWTCSPLMKYIYYGIQITSIYLLLILTITSPSSTLVEVLPSSLSLWTSVPSCLRAQLSLHLPNSSCGL